MNLRTLADAPALSWVIPCQVEFGSLTEDSLLLLLYNLLISACVKRVEAVLPRKARILAKQQGAQDTPAPNRMPTNGWLAQVKGGPVQPQGQNGDEFQSTISIHSICTPRITSLAAVAGTKNVCCTLPQMFSNKHHLRKMRDCQPATPIHCKCCCDAVLQDEANKVRAHTVTQGQAKIKQ